MEIVFGKGDILVTECGNSERRHILIEHGRVLGSVGAKGHLPERAEGAVILQEDIEAATVALTFDNPISLAVVLEKALVGMVAFRRGGRTIGEDHAALGEAIRELCQELLGMKDEVAE
jgi:hypothetical protein